MKILVVGSGGREHALAWKLAQSRLCTKLFASPGNPGIAEHAELVALDVADHAAVLAFCEAQRIGLVVIGPEAPLVDGLADSMRAVGVPVFGPSKAAAQLEGSKAFTKELCERHAIPTAAFKRVTTEAEGLAALDAFPIPVVIKADGLAAGKGVIVAAVLSIPAIYGAMVYALGDMNAVIGAALDGTGGFTGMALFWCSLVGLAITGLIIWITEYYTGTNYRPVRSIAKASETGHGTNVIQGLAISLESTAMPTIVICAAVVWKRTWKIENMVLVFTDPPDGIPSRTFVTRTPHYVRNARFAFTTRTT